jgi:chromosome segregation ATPase
VHYKKELKSQDDNNRTSNQWRIDEYKNRLLIASTETAQCKQQLERALSLIETQKLSIKLLQDELGEEAEFDAEETAQMRSVRRECEKRVNQYQDRMVQLQSDMQREIDQQNALLQKVTKERDDSIQPTEIASRHPITHHWTVDWDVATIIEALEELYPLQAEHKHLDLGSRWQKIVDNSIKRVRVQNGVVESEFYTIYSTNGVVEPQL